MANLCENMEYQLKRSKRKTISISFDKEAKLIVRAPEWVPLAEIEAFLIKKAEWIEATRRRLLRQKKEELSTRLRLENGDEVPYLGKKLVLTVIREDRKSGRVKRVDERLLLFVPYAADHEYCRGQLEKWFRKEASVVIGRRARLFADLLSVSYKDIRIKDQKSCWGSCSAQGNMNFNWRIMMAPQEVCDYVILHELCHLRFMDHSREFWELMGRICADYKRRRAWLKENASELYLL